MKQRIVKKGQLTIIYTNMHMYTYTYIYNKVGSEYAEYNEIRIIMREYYIYIYIYIIQQKMLAYAVFFGIFSCQDSQAKVLLENWFRSRNQEFIIARRPQAKRQAHRHATH
jgi:hypothetical protein